MFPVLLTRGVHSHQWKFWNDNDHHSFVCKKQFYLNTQTTYILKKAHTLLIIKPLSSLHYMLFLFTSKESFIFVAPTGHRLPMHKKERIGWGAFLYVCKWTKTSQRMISVKEEEIKQASHIAMFHLFYCTLMSSTVPINAHLTHKNTNGCVTGCVWNYPPSF